MRAHNSSVNSGLAMSHSPRAKARRIRKRNTCHIYLIPPPFLMRKLRFSLPEGVSDADALLKYFDVPSPAAWRARWNAYPLALRQTQAFEARKEAVAAWVREAEIVAGQIPLADYDEAKLRSSLDELRRLTRERVEVALDKAQQICSHAGVALVMVPELPGTRLSGCARWLSDSHALVGLTTRY